jgi:TrmH family RNA methyltransferase
LRTAAAVGVGRVVAAPGTVDLYSPKVVRAAAGAHFGLALAAPRAWDEVGGTLEPGAPVYLADARADRRYWDVDWTASSSLIVSSEAHGASDAARRLATQTIGIPMAGGVESLNAGVAGSIILYEAARQRALAGVTQ